MERQRKLLFNIRQRLKGNIRVYCRVRPALAKEKGQTVAGLQVSDSAVRLDVQKASVSGPSIAGFDFEFDRVFDASSSQVQVFEEISQ
ncbi:MAG: hypothetical protein KVP17_002579 [Porospora cf. gigantea B]|nr:MAG: hypothetical protein KVP17_002579 [Porospora cf. gigantea B]